MACKESHITDARAAVPSLKQQCMGMEQYREEVLHHDILAVTASPGNVEQHVPEAANGSCKGVLQPALQKEPDHRQRDKADADRDKHKEGSHDLSRPSSRASSRELHRHHHHKERRHDKSSQRHDRSTHRQYDNSSARHSKHQEHPMSENQSRHSANLSSHANGRRPSSSSLPSSKAASKDDKRHQQSPDRPRSGSDHRKRSRSPHERSHDRWVHQER